MPEEANRFSLFVIRALFAYHIAIEQYPGGWSLAALLTREPYVNVFEYEEDMPLFFPLHVSLLFPSSRAALSLLPYHSSSSIVVI